MELLEERGKRGGSRVLGRVLCAIKKLRREQNDPF
jgi:hypothetical protein